MAGKARVEFEGAIFHVLNRGDRRELIFWDNADRQRSVETLAEACAKTGVRPCHKSAKNSRRKCLTRADEGVESQQ
jgi:hypothetical protein